MKIAGIQLDIAWEQPTVNFAKARRLALEAVAQGAQLLVLPEMFATGFSMNVPAVVRHADEIQAFLASLAAELRVFVVGGVARPANAGGEGRGVNLALAYGPDGQILASYQKIHPFSYGDEQKHYLAGDCLAFFQAQSLRCSLFICYDLRFPEIFRAAADNSDLMLVVANWPTPRRHAWRQLLQARAIENQCYVLGVNRTGCSGGLEYRGDSLLVDPLGELLADGQEPEGLVMGPVQAEEVTRVREKFPFLKDRRLKLYPQLS